ncbi:pyridoxamine 5-phosphate oxidase [Pseudooceanicola sp. CBS1P-1]|uniref:Pyridoxamine 5-phosphate oxidase n=1 Tax=Pseudooceanicola albus TaxID=2692189 RepID=A0A6L7G6D0_9RHOB|nr:MULTISPECIES: pyridoxamine 5-phosphate oxidase [Pseudooceanicola]MBT9384531.1 pyridoxamine 5-phosphate oxidase [Pseudooceanicola endophyticus]MXN18233.1 pyridoxamine 5-phosphate oxidase [Pseudooceanicola albus]
MNDPFRPADDAARTLSRELLAKARHGALAVLRDGAPFVTRIALTTDPRGLPLTLVSRLAVHTAPLLEATEVSLLLGEPGARGDPLTHPRLTLQARPDPVLREDPGFDALAAHYVARRPKAKLYIGFGDFLLVRLRPLSGMLNGGFGKAYRLTPQDLGPA